MIGGMNPPTMTVYGIPNCDTVKKARAWLSTQGVDYQFHDFKKQGVPAERLPQWIAALGWEKLLNRQGTTWRKLDAAVQAGVQDAASAADAPALRRVCDQFLPDWTALDWTTI